jgi:prolipoprotein diacylglyceryltransferase
MSVLEPHPILWQSPLGPITAHGVFFAIAGVVAAWFFAKQLERAGICRFVEGVEAALLIYVVGLLGARLGYLLTYRSEWTSFGQLLAIWQGGLVSFWGMVAGFGYAWYRVRNLKPEQRTQWWLAFVLAGLLGWGVGRIGNYVMGDSYGVVSSVWATFYGRVPIQLFESVLCFGLFFVLLKQKEAAWFGVIGYLVGRLVIDMWRDELLVGPLHLSQWTSLILLLILIPLYVRRNRS